MRGGAGTATVTMRSARDVAQPALAAPRVAHGEASDRRRGAEPEVDARVLGREVAAARLNRRARASGRPASVAVTTAPGEKRDSATSSQWPVGPVGRRSTSLPPIVLMATSMRPSLPASAAASAAAVQRAAPRERRSAVAVRGSCPRSARAPSPARRPWRGSSPGSRRPRATRSGVPEFARSTNEAPQPAKPVPSAGSKSGRAFANVAVARARNAADGSPRELRHEQVSGPFCDGDAHAGVRVGDAPRRRAVLEAEAEAGGIGLRAAGPRDVHVELVRVLVVRDVEVGTAVAVDVDERRAEPVAEARPPRGPPARRPRGSDRAAEVEEEQVADAGEVRREAGERARHRVVRDRSSRRRRCPAGRRRSRPRPATPAYQPCAGSALSREACRCRCSRAGRRRSSS